MSGFPSCRCEGVLDVMRERSGIIDHSAQIFVCSARERILDVPANAHVHLASWRHCLPSRRCLALAWF